MISSRGSLREYNRSDHVRCAAYSSAKDSNIKVEEDMKNEARLSMFDKGQSKRIWGELFKVLSENDLWPSLKQDVIFMSHELHFIGYETPDR